ncbi:MAG: SusC/RagA family TonB-linked outer membrane protein, partial [Bacteroidetes bacterium]|nr:SusC/RagA family TonB-linked outer membrane protein [Bacteroidota bacterium]
MTTIKAYTGLSGLLKAGLILLFSAWSGQHIATAQTPAKQLVAEYLQNKENVNLEKISVSIDFEEIPLDEAILRLGEISGVNFNYNADLLSGETNVTYQAENATLSEILTSILPNSVTYITARNIVILKEKPEVIPKDYFQQSITGTVTDVQTGEPLPGVNVIAGDGSGDSPVGTTTDTNGEYEVELADEVSTLIFSYVGYERFEVSIEGRTKIDVELAQDVQMLEDVVVVGYSERRQSELSSSVTVVNEEELQRSSITEDLGTMLQGKVPGLIVSNTDGNPGSTTQAVIRGVGSIGAGYNPLYVIDGVIGDRLSVNPSDIESITVLKDAAATGLYGSRAANGVIVITTKRGQAGETRVSYRGSYGITQDRDFETMNSEELYEQYRMGHENLYNDAVAEGDPNFTNISLDQYLNDVLPSSLLEQNTPWNSLLTRRGYVSQHQLSVSGGNERTTFFVSGNYYDELGTLLGTEYQKFDLRFNLDHQLSETLNLQTRVSTGIDKFPNDPLGGQSSTRTQYYNNIPWDPAFNDDGTPVNPLAPGQGWFGNASSNYFFNRENQESEIKNAYLNVDLELGYDIADWISFSTTNRVGLSGRDFSQVLSQRHEIANAERGRVTQNYRYGNSFLTSNVLNLDHDFSDHSFSGILGQE